MKKHLLSLALTASVFLNSYTFGMNPSVSPTDSRPQTSNALAEVPTFGAYKVEYSNWATEPFDRCFPIVLMRHISDETNSQGFGHASNLEDHVTIENAGPSQILHLFTLRMLLPCSLIVTPETLRHSITAELIKQPDSLLWSTSYLDEQKLGNLSGKSEREIMKSLEFKKMIENPFYVISGENSESGYETMRRFDFILNTILWQLKHDSRYASRTTFVIGSRCMLNWGMRSITGNFGLMLQMNNLDSIALAVCSKTKQISVFSKDGRTPQVLSIGELIRLSLQSKVFPSLQEIERSFNSAKREAELRLSSHRSRDFIEKDEAE